MAKYDDNADDQHEKWKNAVLSVLDGGGGSSGKGSKEVTKVKKIRKLVLLSLQLDESDKSAKKQFKTTVQSLEKEGTISVDSDGIIALLLKDKDSHNKKKRKSNKDQKTDESDKKSSKKKKHRKDNDDDDDKNESSTRDSTNDEDDNVVQNPQHTTKHKINIDDNDDNNDNNDTNQKPCTGNPQGVTRLFIGNLPFTVDETILEEFVPGVTHIKWITDKETGKFYGSAFIEMSTSKAAASAVAKAGTNLMNRPIKINFAPARPGEKWPPEKKIISGGGNNNNTTSSSTSSTKTNMTTGATAGGTGLSAMSEKPEGCLKLFIGNLSYDIDDDAITKFFANVDAEVKAVRWIHHKDTGDFKGVGFVEFWNTEACDKAAALNGKTLLGRPIRIDWTD